MTTRADYHVEISRVFLQKARAYLAAGDLLQASEQGWGSAAQIVKAAADARGWNHSSHSALFNAVNRLASETDDPQLRRLFQSANALHQNFYEGWMPEEFVADGLDAIDEFATRLGRLIN